MKIRINYLTLCLGVFYLSGHAIAASVDNKIIDLPRSEIFPPEDLKLVPLQGEIANGRYYAPKNVFSCKAYDFGSGTYIAQDTLMDCAACVGFYSSKANFKKAEVAFTPTLKKLDRKALREVFDGLGIGILKTVDHAQGIEVLKEEMIENYMLFVAISIQKMAVLRDLNGNYMSSTRGYLVFQDKDKLVVLSNQEVTLAGQRHVPNNYIDKLKGDILEFRKTFEFGPVPKIDPST